MQTDSNDVDYVQLGVQDEAATERAEGNIRTVIAPNYGGDVIRGYDYTLASPAPHDVAPTTEETPQGKGNAGERTGPMRDDVREDAVDSASVDAGEDTRFTSERAREAARLRWAKQRERDASETEAAQAAVDGDVRMVYVPVHVGEIIKRYDKDARNGSVSAGKELRAWLDNYPPSDEAFDPAALDRRIRARIYARLLAEVEGEEAAISSRPTAN